MLKVGTKAPPLPLLDQDGNMRTLGEFQGKRVILYFYPKDMSAGCTSQALATLG